jgi:hypothetical protein
VDISQFGVEIETSNVRTGNTKMVPAVRFSVWKESEQYFRANGADEKTIADTHTQLSKTSVAVITII